MNKVQENYNKLASLDYSFADKRVASKVPMDIEELRKETLRFLAMAVTTKKSYTPSKWVDEYWHETITQTQLYQKMTNATGVFAHHVPSRGTLEDKLENQKNYKTTLEDYNKFFGTPNPTIWVGETGCNVNSCKCHACSCESSADSNSGESNGSESTN